MNLEENITADLSEVNQPSMTHLAFSKYLQRNGNKMQITGYLHV